MTLPSANFIKLATELDTVNALIVQIEALCNQLKSQGTILYNDANLVIEYPNDGPTVKTWMTTTNTQLTNFLAALTSMPSLNT